MKEPKDGMTRNEYLKSLPQDEDGNPIIEDYEQFQDFAYEREWDYEFVQQLIDDGHITAYDYDMFYQITE